MLKTLADVAAGVTGMHAAGLIHRDVKVHSCICSFHAQPVGWQCFATESILGLYALVYVCTMCKLTRGSYV